MKKALFVVIVAILVSAASCTKISSPVNYWSFNGTVYNVGSCTDSNAQVHAVNTDGANTLTLNFAASTQPVAAGTYTVVSGFSGSPGTGQVSLSMTIGTSGQTYLSTPENGTEKVTVSAASGGKVSVAGTVIEMLNNNNPTDSNSVNFSFVQTQ